MTEKKIIWAGLLGLALTAVTAQAAAPSLSYEISGNELIISYTGTLLRSSDAVNWSEVASASSPYKIALGDKKLFFCAKASDEPVDPLVPGQDVTITLPGGVALNLNWIEPGTFMMGSPEDELGAGGDEILHQVTLTQGYWLGKYEITQAQYEAIMGENPSRFKGTDQPVESVSWNDAMAFCEKLTEREQAAGRLLQGYEYTLPTEAQWEYACRAGTMTAFNNGTNIETDDQIYGECPHLDPVGWYWCNSESKTHPVGQKRPNDWGLYDMHGNVMEWCLDAKNRYPETPVVDPVQEDIEPYYAVRGGSYSYYDDGAKRCRSAARSVRLNTSTSMSLGFRVALLKASSNKDTLVITLDDSKEYDGTPLVSDYSIATATGLMPGDKLTAGVVTSAGSKVGSYSYPNTSMITKPFETAMGITNYNVSYVIKQSITEVLPDKNITVPLSEDVDLDMIWIEPGTFLMGSPEDELGRQSNEVQHQVTLTKGYWLGKYEVTQAQYEAVTGKNPSYFKGVDLPVERVTWNNAVKFCEWLTAQERAAGRLPEGYEYTLPTEAQWEYACRAGTTTAFNNGTNIPTMLQREDKPCPNLDEVGWYRFNSDETTHPVGQKQPNAWGLYDMHGNVYEWCLDSYEKNYPTTPVTDPKGDDEGSNRVIRGGSWIYYADGCRSAFRYDCGPDHRYYGIGFRVALAPVQ